MQSFNRIEDPVIDQDNAKLLGAAGGGYGAWKQHGSQVAKRKGFIDRAIGRVGSVGVKPVKAMVGAGLGALAAGTLARYMNKENKEKQERDMMAAYTGGNSGMTRYASEDENKKTDKLVGKGIRGGLLGALAASIVGASPLKGAGAGALANAGYHMYKNQKETNTQTEDQANYSVDGMSRYAMEKDATLRTIAKGLYSKIGGKALSKAKSGLKTNAAALRKEFTQNAPGVNPITGMSLKKA